MAEKIIDENRSPFAYLQSEEFILLKTFRKDGTPVATPVWFAFDPSDDRKLYVVTDARAGKVKRLRNNPRVQIAPCDRRGNVHGPEIEATATLVLQADRSSADTVLARRFGFLYRLIALVTVIRRAPRTYLQIVPDGA